MLGRMGQDVSSPIAASATTHGQAFTQTEYTRMVMDQLLNYMIKQLSIRDLLQMSKESECKKYILFKANSIYQYFYELRIFPTKDAKGLLTFRKIEDLVNPKGDQDKERQSLCLIIAYFYTRVFQIYGALALTLIDDMNAMTSSGIMSLPGSDSRLMTPGYYAQQAYYGRGGAGLLPEDESIIKVPSISKDPRDSLKTFAWIRSFLTPEYDAGLGFKTRYSGSSADKGYVYFKADSGLKDKEGRYIPSSDILPLQFYQHGKFYIGATSEWSTLEIYTLTTPSEIKVKTNKLLFKNQYGENISVNTFEMTFYVVRQFVDGKFTYAIKDKSEKDVSQFLANYFSEIIIYLKDATKQRKEFVEKTKTDTTTGRRSEEGITSHLRVEKMISDLTERKPLGHCIARALQLLKTEPFANEPGISQICSATFADNKRVGVVKRGAPLSESPGLFALANLFYDTITIGSPNLTIGKNKVDGKPSSMEQYVAFMNTLSKQYTVDGKELTSAEYEEKGLSSIRDTRDEAACPTSEDIPLSLQTTAKVHAVVQSMFQDQVKHAAKCFNIISQLFNITYDKTTKKPITIKLHENLIAKGFPELERINREARELLVSYYTNCENKYWTGMKHVIAEQKEKKAVTNALIRAEADAKAKAEAAAKAAANAKAKEEADAKAHINAMHNADLRAKLKAKEEAEARLAEAKRIRDELLAKRKALGIKPVAAPRRPPVGTQPYDARMEQIATRRVENQAAKKAELPTLKLV